MQKSKVIVVIQTLNLDGLDHILNIFVLIRYSPPCRSNTSIIYKDSSYERLVPEFCCFHEIPDVINREKN
jgi:hypothetical protein